MRVGGERRAHHDPVHLPGHGADQRLLRDRVLLAVGEEDGVPALPRAGLHAAQHPGVEGVVQVGYHDADVAGPAGDEAARRRVRLVSKLLGRRQHPLPGGTPDQVRGAERTGHRGGGHLGPSGDVMDGYRHCTHFLVARPQWPWS